MKSLIILKRIKVENANAISGLTYGFPAVTHFMGFTHALSRELNKKQGVSFGRIGIICHDHEIRTYCASWDSQLFSLSRNPLNKKGESASFNEEGRLHFEISLIIECNFTVSDLDYETGEDSEDLKKFQYHVLELASVKRIAGGYITKIDSCQFLSLPQQQEDHSSFISKTLLKLLPGFALIDRTSFLQDRLRIHPELNSLDALLDFCAIKTEAEQSDENDHVKWTVIPKPNKGWLVPLQVGYKAISPLFKEGVVSNVRDNSVPFCFVEAIYSLGEWLGLHRIQDSKILFWDYQYNNDMYICSNLK